MGLIDKLESPQNVRGAWSIALVAASIVTAMAMTRPVEAELDPGVQAEVVARNHPILDDGEGGGEGSVRLHQQPGNPLRRSRGLEDMAQAADHC